MYLFFSLSLTTSRNNITTNECTYHTVIKSGIVTETRDASQRSNVYTQHSYNVSTLLGGRPSESKIESYVSVHIRPKRGTAVFVSNIVCPCLWLTDSVSVRVEPRPYSFLCPCHTVSVSMFVSGSPSVFNSVHIYVWKTVRKVRLSTSKSIYVWKVFSIFQSEKKVQVIYILKWNIKKCNIRTQQ